MSDFDCHHNSCLLLDTILQLSDKVLCFLSVSERKIIKISNSPYLLGGHNPADICEMGYVFFESILLPEDYFFLVSIHSSFDSFFKQKFVNEDGFIFSDTIARNIAVSDDEPNI